MISFFLFSAPTRKHYQWRGVARTPFVAAPSQLCSLCVCFTSSSSTRLTECSFFRSLRKRRLKTIIRFDVPAHKCARYYVHKSLDVITNWFQQYNFLPVFNCLSLPLTQNTQKHVITSISFEIAQKSDSLEGAAAAAAHSSRSRINCFLINCARKRGT